MSQYQIRSNVNIKDRPSRAFDDDRNRLYNISTITTPQPTPLRTTTITTKHYPTEAELHNNLSRGDKLRREEYQKLVEKHQQELTKRKVHQQRQQHLQRQQLRDQELGIQFKRNYDDHSGVRITGIYPPEYFDIPSDEDDIDAEVEYYLPPPPPEFTSSVTSTPIVAIPPPAHFNHHQRFPANSSPDQIFKTSDALKKDTTNLKLFVTTATFSPAKSLANNTKVIHDGANEQHKTAKNIIINDQFNKAGNSFKSDKNQIDFSRPSSNAIGSESLGSQLQNQSSDASESTDAKHFKANSASSKQTIEDKVYSDGKVSPQPPVLIRRSVVDKKEISDYNNTRPVSYATSKTVQDSRDQSEFNAGNSKVKNAKQDKQNNEFIKSDKDDDSQPRNELQSNNPSRRSIEIRTDSTAEPQLKRNNSLKYKMDTKPPAHNKSNGDKNQPSQEFRLPTPELKIHYVSKSPKTSVSEAPSESPDEKSKSKSFFTPWSSKRHSSNKSSEKQNEDKKSTKISNTQKFLNLLNVKGSPSLPFKLNRHKDDEKRTEERESRKSRKKSLDLLDKKKPLPHHSTPPAKVRLHSESDPEDNRVVVKATSLLKRPGQLKKDGKVSAELMAVEADAFGVPTKHLILTPSSGQLHSNDGSRTTSPTHGRTTSDGSSVFSTDLMSTSNKSEQIPSQHFVICAIDFGTTYSGYAFCFVRDPDSLHIMRRWEGGDPGLVNQKTMTTLLLDPNGKFHSFGFTARDAYHDLEEEAARKWFYFEKFKMALHHNAELNKDTTIRASNGKPYSALNVFSHALKYFKDHALQELTDQSETSIYNEDIRWVITVPAIWKAPAKQFMRQAAYQAGIASADNPSQLMIALEPEAASIYVRKLRIYQLVPETYQTTADTTPRKKDHNSDLNVNGGISKGNFYKDIKYQTLPTSNKDKDVFIPSASMTTVGQEVDIDGTKYMVVDCGGGTVDITVHEMEANGGSLKELHKAMGGPYGSIGIDHEFEKLLVSIFGPEFIDSFKLKRPSGWIDLMNAFESRKRSAHPDKQNSLNVSLPFSLIEFYKKNKGGSVESAIKKFGNKEITWSSQGMLRLTPGAMKKLFKPTVDKILQAVGDVLNHPNSGGVKYLFLVGGFAESGILQYEIRREFGHLVKIIIPQDVGTTILKGAVCFGLDPTVVSERRCRMTYGVGVLNKFIDGVHPPSKLVVKDGVRWCIDVFDKFVVADQPVALGDTVVRSYAPARAGQRTSVIHIYSSEKSDVSFVTDPGVTKCGTLCLDDVQYRHNNPVGVPVVKSRRSREIQARMTFGDTEIKVSAIDVATGKCVKSTIDFLGR